MKEGDFVLKTASNLKSKWSHDRQHFVMLRNEVVKTLRKAKADYFLKIIEQARGNSQIIWKQLNKLKGHQKR